MMETTLKALLASEVEESREINVAGRRRRKDEKVGNQEAR